MKKRIQLTLDDSTVVKCDGMAKSLGMSRSGYISFLINTIDEVAVSSAVTPLEVSLEKIPAYQGK